MTHTGLLRNMLTEAIEDFILTPVSRPAPIDSAYNRFH
jgi:hypothetical protein